MKHNLSDIKLGDKIYFESTKYQSNHDHYWEVLEKIKGTTQLIVQLDKGEYSDLRHVINVSEVKYIEPRPI